ncbi:MAG: extracellular solute-binding protein, partial [Rhodospirillaceae bacterium]|nr:extracellular solute-binding protein [Rhodospirillaceae bacterium]
MIMDIQEFRSRLANRDITRRDITKVLASVGVGSVAIHYGPNGAMAEEAVDPDLTVFTWSGYDIAELCPDYIEKYQMIPAYALFGEEEEAFQKMRQGFPVDIAAPCTYSLGRWFDGGLLSPIDTTRLEHWDNIFDSLKNLEGSHQDGVNYFLPLDWGNSSVLFRTDLAPEYMGENNSWGILFDEKYANRLGIFDSVDGVFGVVGAYINAENPFDMTDAELEKATELLRQQREVMRFYWTDQSTVEQGLATGELVASYAWNSAIKPLKEQGIPVEYMNPKEGIYTWVCGQVLISTGDGSEDKAYDYLNAALQPEVGAW